MIDYHNLSIKNIRKYIDNETSTIKNLILTKEWIAEQAENRIINNEEEMMRYRRNVDSLKNRIKEQYDKMSTVLFDKHQLEILTPTDKLAFKVIDICVMSIRYEIDLLEKCLEEEMKENNK